MNFGLLERHGGGGRGEERDLGSTLVEAVIVVPVLMVLLLVVVQVALWAHAAQVVHLAASEGDRVARSMGGGTVAGAETARSVTGAAGSDLAPPSVAIAVVTVQGALARVTVSGTAESILPGFGLRVSSTVIGPFQEFRTTG